jgi:hypothetical protein
MIRKNRNAEHTDTATSKNHEILQYEKPLFNKFTHNYCFTRNEYTFDNSLVPISDYQQWISSIDERSADLSDMNIID